MQDEHEENPLLTAALRYRELGLSVMPVKGKIPLVEWKELQTTPANEEQIRAWWSRHPSANIGIITGKVSGIVVLDIDKREHDFKIPPTAIVKTGNGWHVWCRYPGHAVTSNVKILDGLDVRAEGGYVVAPPSKHESGAIYEWVDGCSFLEDYSLDTLAELPDWFIATKKESRKEQPINALAGPLIPEGKRNDSAARFIGQLIRGKPPEMIQLLYPAVQEWNKTKTEKPLPEDELSAVWNSICARELSGRPEKTQSESPRLPDPISHQELFSKDIPGVKWAIEKLFEGGTINMISAAPNQYKSWILLHMAECISKGEKVFGQYTADKQKVLIVNEEDPERMLQERIRLLMENNPNLEIFYHIGSGVKLGDEIVDQLLKQVATYNIGVIMFDSFRAVHDADENDSQTMQAVMDHLKKFSQKGITVIFTHHNRKRAKQQFGGATRDDLGEEARGSTAIMGAIHGNISCEPLEKEGQKYTVIYQRKLKGAEKMKPFLIKPNQDGERFWFTHEGEYITADETMNRVKMQIIDTLRSTDYWLSRKDLINLGIGTDSVIRNAVTQLAKAELINSKKPKEVREMGGKVEGTPRHNAELYHRLDEDA